MLTPIRDSDTGRIVIDTGELDATVQVENRPGGGVVVSVVDGGGSEILRQSFEPEEAELLDVRGMRVLVADDVPYNVQAEAETTEEDEFFTVVRDEAGEVVALYEDEGACLDQWAVAHDGVDPLCADNDDGSESLADDGQG